MLSRTNLRSALFAGVAVAAVISTAASAQTGPVNFDIASGDLGDALGAYAKQSGVELFYQSRIVDGRSTQGLHGAYAPRDALDQLLKGTGLVLAMDQSGAMVVREASDPQSGSAAGGGADAGTVQALIVTAQKREENIQDVPIAMSAFSQEDLTRSQVTGGPDLMTQVPNFTFTKTNFTGYSIQIRGIGTQAISATTDAAVAVAENNTPFIRNRFFEQEFYDLQRVEVLRGPQGTLYGRNATAGVVNIITAKPSFHYEGKLSGDLGNYNSSRIEGMINLPLVEDKVALRVAGAWTKRDGYDENQITGARIDGRDLWSTRVSLRITPTDRLNANLIWEHFNEDDDRLRSGKQLCHEDEVTNVAGFDTTHFQTLPEYGQSLLFTGVQGTFSQGCAPASLYSTDSFEVPNGLSLPYYSALAAQALPAALQDPYVSTTQSHDLRVIESTVNPIYRAKSDIAELQVSYDLTDKLTLTSETAYSVDELFSMQDFNRFNTAPGAWDTGPANNPNHWVTSGILSPDGYFCDPQIGCANRLVGIDVSTARSRQLSQEFRVSSNNDGPFNFSLGANFLRYDTRDKYYVFFNSLTMYSADSGSSLGQWQPGVTDNAGCQPNGMRQPKIDQIQDILGCVYIDPNPITSLNDLGHNYFLSNNPYKLISYAVFGEAYYQITDALKLTAGLRWTVDKKEAPRIPSWVLGADTVGYPVADVVRQEWREPTGRLAIDWKPDLGFTDQTLVYASYGRGYKAGGMNPPPAGIVLRAVGGRLADPRFTEGSATQPKTFDPEFVNAFEVGSKNTLADGRLTLNLAGFYYDYKGYQISQIVNRSAVNLNFDASVKGFELESDWRPMENLRFGLKLGYEDTKLAKGSRAIDLMDRTAGDPNWLVVRPFPTLPSNCVLPAWLFIGNPTGWSGGTNPGLVNVGGRGGGNPGGCEETYILGDDPATGRKYYAFPYQNPDPNDPFGLLGDIAGRGFRTDVNYAAWSSDINDYPCWPTGVPLGNQYPGVDPQCLAALSNNGQGFYKNISGNELPNAPHYTATLTTDYTIPLPNSWLMTLHSDLYYQSEAWTRVFNTAGYDKLKAYTNVNFAAIFSNEEAGWKIMAYVKNVMDRDSITGAFLNSDDTGLTTNVFLTEPRLYGLRVTKEWTGQGWWTGANPNHTGPYPLTVELSGQVQRQKAPYETLTPDLFANFPAPLDTTASQNRDLDWGDGREVKLTYRPDGSPWAVSGSYRYGRTNSATTRVHSEIPQDAFCALPTTGPFAPFGKAVCVPGYSLFGQPPGRYYNPFALKTPRSWSDSEAHSREEHAVVDFSVGRDVGMGGLSSAVGAGVRYAQFKSDTLAHMSGLPTEYVRDGWRKYYTHYLRYDGSVDAHREFKGAGPLVNWDAAAPILGGSETGHLNVDWSIAAGMLFGKQKTRVEGQGVSQYHGHLKYPDTTVLGTPQSFDLGAAPRSKSVSVPVVDLSLGLSYDIQRIKVSTGYRWERYFNVLDGGYAERKQYDRTFDGPYFKIAVGFGG